MPFFLLERLQIYPVLQNVHWQTKNTIVLFGGGVTHHSKSGAHPSLFTAARIKEGARLYFACKKVASDCSILVSGGDPLKLGLTEAEVMRQELAQLGVPDSAITLESKSNNTYQNSEFSSALLRSRPGNILLVSSGGHLRRALLYLSRFGVSATPAPSDHLNAQWSWIPLSFNFFLTDLALHEYVGLSRNTRSATPGSP